MKIYLTRHGQTEWNLEGKMQGSAESKLTQRGIDEAKKLSDSLQDIIFDSIYASPLDRAYETAKYIRRDRDIEIQQLQCLKEMSFGVWEGMLNSEFENNYREEYDKFWNKPHLFEPNNGESFQEIIHRVRACLHGIIENEKGENILIVTHTIIIKAIYSIIKNYTIEEFWNPPFINNTCLSIIEVEGKNIRFILEADTSHLYK